MAKRVKMKKGSIGKKALAAILAASMVLSSSAFSVMAATLEAVGEPQAIEEVNNPVSVIDADGNYGIATVDNLNGNIISDNGNITVRLPKAGVDVPNGYYTYDGTRKMPNIEVMYKGTPLNEDADYRLEWGENTNAGGKEEMSTSKPETGPWIHIIFSDNWTQSHGGELNRYVGFKIDPLDLSAVQESNVTLKWNPMEGFIYDGKEHYPSEIVIRINNKNFELTKDTDYLIDEMDLANNGKKSGDTVSATWNPVTRNYLAGENEHHTITGCGNFTNSLKSNIDFHIQQKTLEKSDISVDINDHIVYQSGATLTTTDVVKNVYDVLRKDGTDYSESDNKDKIVTYDEKGKKLIKDTDYTVEFLQENAQWVKDAPVTRAGEHYFRIVPTGTGDFRSDSNVRYTYVVNNRRTLQMAADAYWATNNYVNGKYANNYADANLRGKPVIYDGTNKFPYQDKHELVIGAASGNAENAGKLVEDVDFTVESKVDEWIDAGTYEIKLKGRPETIYANEEATIKFEIGQRSLTDLVASRDIAAQKGNHFDTNGLSGVSVNVKDYGLADYVYGGNAANKANTNNIFELLEENEDYTCSEESGGKVTITGMKNYKDSVTVDVNKTAAGGNRDHVMPLNDSSIAGGVAGTLQFDEKTDEYKLSADDIKLVETDINGKTKELNTDDFSIFGYQQGAVVYDAGLPKAGAGWVILQGKGAYGGFRKVSLSIGGTTFESMVKIETILDQHLGEVDSTEGTGLVHWTLNANDLNRYIKVVYLNGADYTGNYDVEIYDGDQKVISYSYTNKTAGTGARTIQNAVGSIANTGTYEVRVKPEDGRFEGYAKQTMNVLGKPIDSVVKIESIPDQTYTGQEIKPAITLTPVTDVIVKENTDYTIEYAYNTDVGIAKVRVVGTGKYSDIVEKDFRIIKAKGSVAVSDAQKSELAAGVSVGGSDTVDLEAYIDGAKAADSTMSYTLKSDDESVVKINDKRMEFVGKGTTTVVVTPVSKNIDADPITVEVTVKGTVEKLTVSCTPSRLKKVKKSFTVTTNTVAGAEQWEIRYSLKNLNNTTKGSKIADFYDVNKVKQQVVKCNKSGKKYYVQCRVTKDGVTSAWSKVKTVTSR